MTTHEDAAALVALVCRITGADRPDPLDLVQMARAVAARFASVNPHLTLTAAADRGLAGDEFHLRYTLAAMLAGNLARPACASGGGGYRPRGSTSRKRRAHFSEIPSGVSRAQGQAPR